MDSPNRKMEFISSSQLQNYEGIIHDINQEFEKSQRIKKEIENEDDKIIIAQLANSKFSEKISHVNVKIFYDAVELLSYHRNELQSDSLQILKCDNCKYYLIEVYITESLMKKIIDQGWLLNIIAKNEHFCINKTIKLRNMIPILEVIPLDENIISCNIEASLILASNHKWLVMKLDSVNVDISFHIKTYKDKRSTKAKTKNLLQIAKRYNTDLDIQSLRKSLTLEYKLFCDVDKQKFVQFIIKNCYNNLDIELFSEITQDKNDFVLNFSTGSEKHILIFNQQDKSLTIKSNVNDLCLLKKYFCKELPCEKKNELNLFTHVKCQLDVPETLQEACQLYSEIRKWWRSLPQ